MKKIAIVALMLFAFPVLASFAATASEKPVTGPKDVFTALNDLPQKSNEGQSVADAGEQEQEAEPEAGADDEEPYDEAWEQEQEIWFLDKQSWEEPCAYEKQESSGEVSASDFRTQGVVCDEGTRYTWYSENVLPGAGLTELNENGRTVNDEGFVTDGEGRIAVASSDYPIGTELDTPFGPATVYDTGCPSGTIDVYTSF